MTRLGYRSVSDKGYVAFAPELAKGAWATISIQDYDTPDQTSPLPLVRIPTRSGHAFRRDLDSRSSVTWTLIPGTWTAIPDTWTAVPT